MTRRRYLIVLIAVAVVGAASIVGFRWVSRTQREARCEDRLRALKYMIEMYANNHRGRFPPNLEVAAQEEDVGRWILSCPAVWADPNYVPPRGNCDYTFIDWPAFTDRLPPQTQPREPAWWGKELDKYPMVFERHLKNALGTGVHVILVNGTLMWDPDARWLKQFAAEHPEVTFPLPQ